MHVESINLKMNFDFANAVVSVSGNDEMRDESSTIQSNFEKQIKTIFHN